MICLNLFKIIGQMDITVAAITELILLTRTFRTKLILSTDSLKSSQQKVLIVFFFNFFYLVISLLFYLFFIFTIMLLFLICPIFLFFYFFFIFTFFYFLAINNFFSPDIIWEEFVHNIIFYFPVSNPKNKDKDEITDQGPGSDNIWRKQLR